MSVSFSEMSDKQKAKAKVSPDLIEHLDPLLLEEELAFTPGPVPSPLFLKTRLPLEKLDPRRNYISVRMVGSNVYTQRTIDSLPEPEMLMSASDARLFFQSMYTILSALPCSKKVKEPALYGFKKPKVDAEYKDGVS